ncbi:MAG: hypothetical protein IJB57_09540 [Clostridia bacterium]|nr:hypothetical protein [Clostridia bacterium]
MKKKLFLLITALLLCTSLVSCDYKETHARHTSDNTIEMMGNTYILLGPDDPFVSVYPAFSTQIYVTESGVPTLLSRVFHEDVKLGSSYMTKNGYFISTGTGIYCRDDIYPNLEELLKPEEYDCYVYEYYANDKYNGYTLTEEEMAAVDKVLSEVAPIPSYDLGYMPVTKHTIDLCYLDTETDATSFLHRLLVFEKGYGFTSLRENGTTEYYIVPEELEKHFDSMTKAYTDACYD